MANTVMSSHTPCRSAVLPNNSMQRMALRAAADRRRHASMKALLHSMLLIVSVAGAEESTPCFPADVAKFIERRDLCDHFRGEEPYDAERQAFLDKNIVEFCTDTDQQLASLKAKYSSNSAVMAKLNQYETDIEL